MPANDTIQIDNERCECNFNAMNFCENPIFAETSEDISPYATFQLSEASTLAQPHHTGPANTLLHSFMYHERALQEGCASTPPPVVLRHPKSSPYYEIVRFYCFDLHWIGCDVFRFGIHSCGLWIISSDLLLLLISTCLFISTQSFKCDHLTRLPRN